MQSIFAFFLVIIHSVSPSNILYVSSVPFPSYHMWNKVLAFELVERGHNVTFLRTYKGDLLRKPNYTEILIEGVHEAVYNKPKMLIHWESYAPLRLIKDIQKFCLLVCHTSANSTGLSYLLNNYKDFKFDLIAFDLTLCTCFYPLIKKFNYPPAIGVTQFPLTTFTAFNFGNQLNSAYIPWYAISYNHRMTFFERMWNFILTYLEIGNRYIRQYKQEHQIARKTFGDDIPTMEKLERHISLVFLNIHPILNFAQPIAPNIIPVGGLHLKESKKLPQDLQKILDDAKDGVIVFSLGTLVLWKEISQHIRENLLDEFNQIQETVLWKFDGEIGDVPNNVIVRKWLPQNDVLGHPNVKLFIGYGGALSTQEAVYHGVPMLCIPFYRDQFHTAEMIVERKFGISLSLTEIESNLVLPKLEEVLRNPTYSKNMKKASKMFRNRKETPRGKVTFWVEYLLEYGNVDFLSTAARDLPFYKSSGLDILIFFVFVVIILIVFFPKLVQFVLPLLRPRKKINSGPESLRDYLKKIKSN